jgi:hypothetical protein
MNEKQIDIIEKIRALKFVCLDVPTDEQEQYEADFYRQSLQNGEMRLLGRITAGIGRVDSPEGYEALANWHKNPKDYDAFHMAAHFAFLGRVVQDILADKVTGETLEIFNDTTRCVENSPLVDEIREFLAAQEEAGASKRHKKEIPNTCGYVLAAALLKGGFSKSYSDEIQNMFHPTALGVYKHKKETNEQLEKLKKFPENLDTAMDRVRFFKRWGG